MNEPAEWHAVLQQLKLGLVQILCLERVLARTVENWIIVDNLKYLYYVVTGKLLAYHFIRNGDW